MQSVRILRILFFLIGVVMISIAAGISWYSYSFLTTATEVEGRVVRNIEYSDIDGTMYALSLIHI